MSDSPSMNGTGAELAKFDGDSARSEAMIRSLNSLPPEIGILLITVGIIGLVLPGPIGTPFFIAGGLALWPRGFSKVEHWFERKYPKMHDGGMRQIERFLVDLEKRYPGTTNHPTGT